MGSDIAVQEAHRTTDYQFIGLPGQILGERSERRSRADHANRFIGCAGRQGRPDDGQLRQIAVAEYGNPHLNLAPSFYGSLARARTLHLPYPVRHVTADEIRLMGRGNRPCRRRIGRMGHGRRQCWPKGRGLWETTLCRKRPGLAGRGTGRQLGRLSVQVDRACFCQGRRRGGSGSRRRWRHSDHAEGRGRRNGSGDLMADGAIYQKGQRGDADRGADQPQGQPVPGKNHPDPFKRVHRPPPKTARRCRPIQPEFSGAGCRRHAVDPPWRTTSSGPLAVAPGRPDRHLRHSWF